MAPLDSSRLPSQCGQALLSDKHDFAGRRGVTPPTHTPSASISACSASAVSGNRTSPDFIRAFAALSVLSRSCKYHRRMGVAATSALCRRLARALPVSPQFLWRNVARVRSTWRGPQRRKDHETVSDRHPGSPGSQFRDADWLRAGPASLWAGHGLECKRHSHQDRSSKRGQ